jgi:methylated-DNA-[protein]-cysteine S-methyltransferase
MQTTNRRHAVIPTSFDEVTLVATDESLTGVYFAYYWNQPEARHFGPKVPVASDPLLANAGRQLKEYLQGTRETFDLPLQTQGDPFQEQVWSLVKAIPYGETTTYGELATKLGDPALARDVGQAVGRNPLAVIVPCHRVVGKDGKLTGYAGGLSRKRALLELEARQRYLRAGTETPHLMQQTSMALTAGER